MNQNLWIKSYQRRGQRSFGVLTKINKNWIYYFGTPSAVLKNILKGMDSIIYYLVKKGAITIAWTLSCPQFRIQHNSNMNVKSYRNPIKEWPYRLGMCRLSEEWTIWKTKERISVKRTDPRGCYYWLHSLYTRLVFVRYFYQRHIIICNASAKLPAPFPQPPGRYPSSPRSH